MIHLEELNLYGNDKITDECKKLLRDRGCNIFE